jgi:hypothetical protein
VKSSLALVLTNRRFSTQFGQYRDKDWEGPVKMRRHKSEFIFLVLFVVIFMLLLVPRSINFTLSNGGHARITPASFWRSLHPEAFSAISYQPKRGPAGSIVLWQDVFDGPVTLFSASNTNVLLCLYDYDVGFRLFRIDTSKKFKPLSPGSDLNHVLFTCTWEIDDGTPDDWKEALSYLQKVPSSSFERQSVSIGIRGSRSPDSVLRSLAYQGLK